MPVRKLIVREQGVHIWTGKASFSSTGYLSYDASWPHIRARNDRFWEAAQSDAGMKNRQAFFLLLGSDPL